MFVQFTPLQAARSHALFVRRMVINASIASVLLLGSLGAGMAGYMVFESMALPDAFVNAAMLLGGMGPVNAPQTTAGKIFAGIYALYAGLVFIATSALFFAPLGHRILHVFVGNNGAKP